MGPSNRLLIKLLTKSTSINRELNQFDEDSNMENQDQSEKEIGLPLVADEPKFCKTDQVITFDNI